VSLDEVLELIDKFADAYGTDLEVEDKGDSFFMIYQFPIETKFGTFEWGAVLYKDLSKLKVQLLDAKNKSVLFEKELADIKGRDFKELQDFVDQKVEEMLVEAKQKFSK